MNEIDPGAVCLQETKLGDKDFNFGLNYCFYRSPPPDSERAKGGAAIIVKKSVQQSTVVLNTTLQAVAVRILFNRFLTICSVYLPPDCDFSHRDLQDLIDQLPTPFFYCLVILMPIILYGEVYHWMIRAKSLKNF